jgi:multiple sugar transport system substrate-binding protein
MRKTLFVVWVVALLLSACGGQGQGEGVTPSPAPIPTTAPTQQVPSQEQVIIRFAVFDWERPMYEDLIAAFEEANPDVKVQIVSANEVLDLGPLTSMTIPEDANLRLASAADVINVNVTPDVVKQGLVRDLTPLMQADSSFQADDFYPNTLEAYQWDGGTWGIPTMVSFQLIFYEKDAFDQAGVDYPQPGWTWDDLEAKALALTARSGDQVTRWGFVPSDSSHRTLVESRVGSVIDDSKEPPVPRFEEAQVVDAVQWYANLFLKDKAAPYFEPPETSEATGLSEEQTLIDSGQAAMWYENDVMWWFRSQQGNVGVAPFPVDDPQSHSTPVSGQGLSISSGTRQPEAAWRFLAFMSRQVLSNLGGGVQALPARQSVAQSSGFWDGLDAELAGALRYAVDHSYSPSRTSGHPAFVDAMRAILSGDKPVKDALAEAQTQAKAAIEEDLAAEAGATPPPTVVVAPPDETPAAVGATTITFVPGLGSLYLDPYRKLAQQFQATHPGVAVEVKMIDLMGGTAPDLPALAKTADCFQWYPGFQDPKTREALLNLDPFLDADPSFAAADFYPAVLKQFQWEGQLWGLPADVTPYVIQYNRDLFDAAGLAYPAIDWTWDDFLAAAVALTKGEGDTKQYGFVPQMYELNDVVLLIGRLGASLVDKDADPPAFTFDDPATVEAMRWYTGLTTEYEVKPTFLTDISNLAGASSFMLEREGMINGGRAAMWTETSATQALTGARTGINVGTAPLPSLPNGGSAGSSLMASGYFISAQTDKRQECWQWITFLSGEPSVAQGMPARRSVAESSAYRQQVGDDRAAAFLASMADAEKPSDLQFMSEEEWMGGSLYWLGQAYSQVLDGKATVEEALAGAQKLADDYRACVITAGDFSQKSWQGCVRETDPSLPDFLFPGG